MYVSTTNSKIVIIPQREHCKSAPHDCCLSLTYYIELYFPTVLWFYE